uniref:ANK_REP_REGION domain-containing protein n=1 Tax=Macrostomum lignano TaxID=282301 RepID=A0A1I8INB6_9PLAT
MEIKDEAAYGIEIRDEATYGIEIRDEATYGMEIKDEATYGMEIKDEAAYGMEIKDEATYGMEIKDEATYGMEIKDEATYGMEIRDEEAYGIKIRDEATYGMEIKDEATYGMEIKDEATYGMEIKDEASYGIEIRDEASYGMEIKDEAAYGMEIKDEASYGIEIRDEATYGMEIKDEANLPEYPAMQKQQQLKKKKSRISGSSVRTPRQENSSEDWKELVNLLGGSETAAIDLFLDPADSVTEMATPNQLSPSDLKPSGAKLKELQEQLVALTIENEALKAQRLETEQLRLKTESETVQLLRRQLAEERAARGCSEEAPVAAAQGWTSGRIPRALARLRRRNNAAVRAAAASDSTADAATGEKDDAAEADDEKDDKEDDKGIAMSLDAAADGGLLDRMKNWAVGGLLSLLEDMQVPTEAERQAAAADDQLSARRLKVNCTRFGRSTQPIFASIKGFVHVVRWKSPSYTVLVMLVYYCALLNNYLLPMILLLCIVRLLLNYFKYRLGWDLEFNFLAEYEDSDGEENSGGAEKERTVGTQVNFVVHVAKKVQLLLNALLVAFVLSMLIPTTAYLFYVGFYLGIKLFVIDPIFAKYPRLRRKYDSVDKIWRTLPTDQQVGYHQTNKDVEKYILPYTEEDQICSPESRPENRSPLCSDDEEFCQVFALPNLECPLVRWKGGKRCAIICKEADKALPDSLKAWETLSDEEGVPVVPRCPLRSPPPESPLVADELAEILGPENVGEVRVWAEVDQTIRIGCLEAEWLSKFKFVAWK